MQSDHRQLVEQYMKAWSSHDMDGIVAGFTEDCVFEDMALQDRFEGHEGLRQFAAAVFAAAPDFEWIPTRTFADGASVCTEWRMSGTHRGDFPGMPATGKRFDVLGVAVDEVSAGRIRLHRDYWSLATMLQQVGLMPAPEA